MAKATTQKSTIRSAVAKPPARRPSAKAVVQPAQPAAATPPPQPQASDAAALRTRLHAEIGQIVLTLAELPRYRHHSIADLRSLIVAPLMRDRIAVARARQASGKEERIGFAIWASVSEAVEAKIKEQIKAGVLPVRLGPDDWTSGDRTWIIDLIAPNRALATAVIANFKQIAKDRPVQLHPIVSRQIDREALGLVPRT